MGKGDLKEHSSISASGERFQGDPLPCPAVSFPLAPGPCQEPCQAAAAQASSSSSPSVVTSQGQGGWEPLRGAVPDLSGAGGEPLLLVAFSRPLAAKLLSSPLQPVPGSSLHLLALAGHLVLSAGDAAASPWAPQRPLEPDLCEE